MRLICVSTVGGARWIWPPNIDDICCELNVEDHISVYIKTIGNMQVYRYERIKIDLTFDMLTHSHMLRTVSKYNSL